MAEKKRDNEYTANEAIFKDIKNMVKGLDYGTVIIKVHDSKIVQVEITQKKRFDEAGLMEKGGGI
jgi:hypothetical protein